MDDENRSGLTPIFIEQSAPASNRPAQSLQVADIFDQEGLTIFEARTAQLIAEHGLRPSLYGQPGRIK